MTSNSPSNVNKFCKERRVGFIKKKGVNIFDFCVIYSLVYFCWFVNLLLIQKEKKYFKKKVFHSNVTSFIYLETVSNTSVLDSL